MQRSLWRGAISFGLVYVPVEMYSGSRDGGLALHMLDSRDFAPVGYQRINKNTGKIVDWAHIVKGYEYKDGQFVALSESDFKQANVKASETIEIVNFTALSEIPPAYFETPYYLAPAKGGDKVYALLREALQSTDKAAVATFVMRGRQHLCAVIADERALMLVTLRFADELIPPDKLQLPKGKSPRLSTGELSMAQKLVQEMTAPWDPAEFRDDYRADLMKRIQEKIRKKQTHVVEEQSPQKDERPKADVIDLMAALKKSLQSGDRKRPRTAAHARSSTRKSAAK